MCGKIKINFRYEDGWRLFKDLNM
jgi:hypothetical protein